MQRSKPFPHFCSSQHESLYLVHPSPLLPSPVPLCRGCHKRCCMGTTVTLIATAPPGPSASAPTAAGREQGQPQHPHSHGALPGWPRPLVPAATGACPTHLHCYKPSLFGALQHCLAPRASAHSHSCCLCCCLNIQIFSRQPCEDPGEAAAMKILFLLFPLLLLLVQGAAGSELQCKHRRGYCSFGRCVPPARPIGRCTGQTICCRGLWG